LTGTASAWPKASLNLATHRVDLGEEFVSMAAIGELSRAAEQAGFDAVFVTDHPFPSDGWLRARGHHALDPLVALAFAAASTTTLRLHTNLFVAAYRNPFIAAKGIATLDVLSAGRLILGVGAGYLEKEFGALGVDFAERNELLDEAITAWKAAWSGESVQLLGRHFTALSNTMLPRPAQRPHPPIWVGGNSRRAIRRAVDLGDGWMPIPSPGAFARSLHTPGIENLDDLRRRMAYLAGYAEEVGRSSPLDIVYLPKGLDGFTRDNPEPTEVVDSSLELIELGVTYLTMTISAETRIELLRAIELYGTEVLPNIATRSRRGSDDE
jgi:probable F420-dependent oxidoreductase